MRFRYLAVVAALLFSPAVFAQSLVNQAVDHLQNNAQFYGLSAADLNEVIATDAYASRRSSMNHVYLRQQWQGIDVVEANYTVTLRSNGDLIHAAGSFVNGLADLELPTDPALTASAAAEALAQDVRLSPTSSFSILGQAIGPDRSTTLSDGGISQDPIPARLVYQNDDDGTLHLSWEIGIYQLDSEHYWQGYVDALTGQVIRIYDLVDKDHWGTPAHSEEVVNFRPEAPSPSAAYSPIASTVDSYRVYAMPVESPNHSGTPPPGDGRTLEVTPANLTASPFGWHDTNGAPGAESTLTMGNNVSAYQDQDNDGNPEPGEQPDGGPGLVFDNPVNFAADPTTYSDAAVTNLFYWNNILHDVLYLYGFDEPAGNFQVNNYGNGGLGGDDVRGEAQDGGGTNNATFFTPVDGQRPRMRMFLWTTTNPRTDGDFDNGIVAHELGHGLSNRLIGGPGNVSCLQNGERPSEGMSDFLTLLTSMEPGDTGADRRGIGTYALGEPTTGNGIRFPPYQPAGAPYSTDFAINDFTYQDSRTQSVPHGAGFIWTSAMWEVTWELVNAFGFNPDIYDASSLAGNNVMMQLFVDAMKMAPCGPGFLDMRDAVLAADAARYGNAHRVQLWTAFARRGMGFSASQGSAGTNADNTEAFDLPPDIPVELVGFDAVQDGSDVLLRWNTASETNNAGFEVQMRRGDEAYDVLTFVDGNGSTTEAQSYSYRATGLASGTYSFRLKQVDFDGAFEYSGEVEVTVGVVGTHVLSEIYPNPFNPQAQFSLSVARTQRVAIGVYDVMGRRVATLHEGTLQGEQAYEFTVDGSSLSSGAYFVRISGETFTETQRVTLLK